MQSLNLINGFTKIGLQQKSNAKFDTNDRISLVFPTCITPILSFSSSQNYSLLREREIVEPQSVECSFRFIKNPVRFINFVSRFWFTNCGFRGTCGATDCRFSSSTNFQFLYLVSERGFFLSFLGFFFLFFVLNFELDIEEYCFAIFSYYSF